MKLSINKKESLWLALILVLFVAVSSLGYFNFIVPLKKDLDSSVSNLKMAKTMYDKAVKEQGNNVQVLDSYVTQQKVPVSPQVQQVVEELNKCSIGADTKIQSMEVKNDVAATQQQAPTNQAAQSELKELSFNIEVESKDFSSVKSFVNQIETGVRYMKVTSMSFSAPAQGVDKPLYASIEVQTFYAPSFTKLITQTPKLNVPQPAKKVDPFK